MVFNYSFMFCPLRIIYKPLLKHKLRGNICALWEILLKPITLIFISPQVTSAPCGSPLQNRNPVRTNEQPGVLECAVTRRDQVDEHLIFLLFKTANLINICIIHKCGEQQVHSLQIKSAAKMSVYMCVCELMYCVHC